MKRDAPTMSKFRTLKRRLGKPHYAIVGVLESLWLATQIDAVAGDIGRLTNEEIAAAVEWDGDADSLIDTLVDTGWLDADPEFRLVVHNWSKHVPNFIKGAFEKHNKKFADEVAKQRAKQGAKQQKTGGDLGAKQDAKEGALTRPILTNSIQSNPNQSINAADAAFDRFWQAFPRGRRTKPADARKAWDKAIKKTNPETIIAAAAEYAASPVGQGDFVAGPAPWLNGERWNDDRAAWNRRDSANGKPPRVGAGQLFDPSDDAPRSL